MRRIKPYFPLSHGVPRFDVRRIISGIIFVIRNGLHWRDAPAACRPPKTIYNRFIRWSCMGVFNRIFAALAAKGARAMLDVLVGMVATLTGQVTKLDREISRRPGTRTCPHV